MEIFTEQLKQIQNQIETVIREHVYVLYKENKSLKQELTELKASQNKVAVDKLNKAQRELRNLKIEGYTDDCFEDRLFSYNSIYNLLEQLIAELKGGVNE